MRAALWFAGGLLLACMFACGGGGSSVSTPQPRGVDRYEAKTLAQEAVKLCLKYPLDAKFNWDAETGQLRDGGYLVKGTVLAKNAFGGALTHTYAVSFDVTNASLSVRAVMLDDKLMYISPSAIERRSTPTDPVAVTSEPTEPIPTELPLDAASPSEAVAVKDWNDRDWSIGGKGTATRMVNAPTSIRHIGRYLEIIGVVDGIAKNTADMLDKGALRKVVPGSNVTIQRIDTHKPFSFAQCFVSNDREIFTAYFVIEQMENGDWKFISANDCNLQPESDVPAISTPADPEPSRPNARTWTSNDGKFTTEAEYEGMEQGKVKLRKADGTTVTIPISKLSKADLDWIKRK